MATNFTNIDSSNRSVHEYSDMRRREYCEMLNQPNDEIDQLNRQCNNSVHREYIEMDSVLQSDHHQYERVHYSAIEENDDKSRVSLKVVKQMFIVVLVAVIVIALVMLCILMGMYILNMANEHKPISQNVLTRKLDTTSSRKRLFVREMMANSWNAYVRHAWGHGELNPVERRPYYYSQGKDTGLSIVASMNTLWTMGLMDEFKRGKAWIEDKLDLRKLDREFEVHDVIVNYVGGLLSCFALTNEQMFLNKALTIAQSLEPAFNTSTGVPYGRINVKTNKASHNGTSLSFVGGFQLDFNYLSDASGHQKYRKRIRKIINFLNKIVKSKNNLYLDRISITGSWLSEYSNLFYWSREFYTSLVKSFIQSNQHDTGPIEMYKEALDAMEEVNIFKVSPGSLYYARIYDHKSNSHWNSMLYSGCYLGAMLSMGASAMEHALALNSMIGKKNKVIEQNRIARHWHLAEQITRTCQLASERTKTGLGPDRFYYNETQDGVTDQLHKDYYLSAEFAESNFILWRLTNKPKYRDNAWEMALAIDRHCRVDGGGYAAIWDVNKLSTTNKIDYQPAQFLSATLKYLYLTFTDDSVLSLDQWVFNSGGHPLPICGKHGRVSC